MNHERNSSPQPNDLTEQQLLIVTGFIAKHFPKSNDLETTHHLEQATAEMREDVNRMQCTIETPEEYYHLMAGVAIATTRMEQLISQGLPPQTAGYVLRTQLAGLAPEELMSQFESPEQ